MSLNQEIKSSNENSYFSRSNSSNKESILKQLNIITSNKEINLAPKTKTDFKIPYKRISDSRIVKNIANIKINTVINKLNQDEQFDHLTPISIMLKRLNKILDSYVFIGFMMSITLYVLFISDIQASFLTIDVDDIINISQVICFSLFTLEIILSCICQENYILSFFFWLDIISTISLLEDISFIFNPLINSLSSTSSANTTHNIFKASSTGRITRILRIVRIIRLIRIVKLYKTSYRLGRPYQKKDT